MNTPSESTSLQVKRLIKSPRERVFAAWTKPDLLKHWFGPATCRVVDVQIDLRVGGKYRFQVISEGMGEMAVGGEYREITAPSRLVFTWQWEDDPEWTNVASVVTVDLTEMDGGTEVRITHEGLPSAEHAGRHEHGWNGCLDKLAARAAVTAEFCGPEVGRIAVVQDPQGASFGLFQPAQCFPVEDHGPLNRAFIPAGRGSK